MFRYLLDDFPSDRQGVHAGLLALRATSREIRAQIDAILFEHIVLSDQLPEGIQSRYGIIPSLYRKRSPGVLQLLSKKAVRVLDARPLHDHISTLPNRETDMFTQTFERVVNALPNVEVFRHHDPDFLSKADCLRLPKLAFRPTKVVRFLDVRDLWRFQHYCHPTSMKTLVINLQYTNHWGQWTEYLGHLPIPDSLVFIFEGIDDIQESSPPWRSRTFGLLAPILTRIVWELPYSHKLPSLTFVGLPLIPHEWIGLDSEPPDLAAALLHLLRAELQVPMEPIDGSPLTDDEIDELFAKIKFYSRDEYSAALSSHAYEDEFCWW